MRSSSNACLVLGAGVSGLAFAAFNKSSVVVEAESEVGGHARSTSVSGWTFDRGPHIMFSKDLPVLQAMKNLLGENIHECVRNNKVLVGNTLLHYPIENDLGKLPADLKEKVARDFFEARLQHVNSPKNLADFFNQRFGRALTDVYFRPYNEKIWNLPLEDLSMSWSDRIPDPPWEDVLAGLLGRTTEGYLHQLHYQYPRVGGYGAIPDALAEIVGSNRIALETRVDKITLQPGKRARIWSNGTELTGFEEVASTLSLRQIAAIAEGVPDQVLAAIHALPVNPQLVVNLGFPFEDTNLYTAIYVPDKEFLPNRISFPKVFSPFNAPKGHTLIQAEITLAVNDEKLRLSDSELIAHTLAGLRERKLVGHDQQPVFSRVERFSEAYVVYPQGYESKMKEIRSFFKGCGINLLGRFGSHNYLNVDGCIRDAISLTESLTGKKLSDEEIEGWSPVPH